MVNMMNMIKIFLGYDRHEISAYHVAANSIIRNSSEPVTIAPLMLSQLKKIFNRERTNTQSTDFSFTRFLVPYLCNYEGWAIFIDSDVVVVDDIAKLWNMSNDSDSAVHVVKHDHRPKETTKFLNNIQTSYPKKNWSSVMLMNCAKCTPLTVEYVNTASGLDLHRFNWIDDSLVGELPARWNHLVDYDAPSEVEQLSIIHYTDGGPWFKKTELCGYADVWTKELNLTINADES